MSDTKCAWCATGYTLDAEGRHPLGPCPDPYCRGGGRSIPCPAHTAPARRPTSEPPSEPFPEVRLGGRHFLRGVFKGADPHLWSEKKADGHYTWAHADGWLDRIYDLESTLAALRAEVEALTRRAESAEQDWQHAERVIRVQRTALEYIAKRGYVAADAIAKEALTKAAALSPTPDQATSR